MAARCSVSSFPAEAGDREPFVGRGLSVDHVRVVDGGETVVEQAVQCAIHRVHFRSGEARGELLDIGQHAVRDCGC